MKVKFLKKFRKRFAITYTGSSRFFPAVLIDHKEKKAEAYPDISHAVAYAAQKILGFSVGYKRMAKLKQREEWRQYYRAYFKSEKQRDLIQKGK